MIPATNNVKDLSVRNFLDSLIDDTESPSDVEIKDPHVRRVCSAIRSHKDGDDTDIPSTNCIKDLEVRRICDALIDNL